MLWLWLGRPLSARQRNRSCTEISNLWAAGPGCACRQGGRPPGGPTLHKDSYPECEISYFGAAPRLAGWPAGRPAGQNLTRVDFRSLSRLCLGCYSLGRPGGRQPGGPKPHQRTLLNVKLIIVVLPLAMLSGRSAARCGQAGWQGCDRCHCNAIAMEFQRRCTVL